MNNRRSRQMQWLQKLALVAAISTFAPVLGAFGPAAELEQADVQGSTKRAWQGDLINRHPSKPAVCEVRLKDTLVDGTRDATVLAGDSPDAFNAIEHPARVVPEKTRVTFKKGMVTFAPHSLSIVKISGRLGS